MLRSTKKLLALLPFFTALLFNSPALAQTRKSGISPVIEAGKISSTPIGWIDFCTRYQKECAWRGHDAKTIILNDKLWEKIVATNLKINKDIIPATDLENYGVEEYWEYPTNGKGDCEDYVLLKKRVLHQQAGIPLEAMLITIVRDQANDGHAVLTLRTDYGDFILDNQEDEIKLWHKTGYKFLKRQNPLDPNQWLALGQGQAEAVAAAR